MNRFERFSGLGDKFRAFRGKEGKTPQPTPTSEQKQGEITEQEVAVIYNSYIGLLKDHGYIMHSRDIIFNSGDKDSAHLKGELKQEPEEADKSATRYVDVHTDQYDCTCGGKEASLRNGPKTRILGRDLAPVQNIPEGIYVEVNVPGMRNRLRTNGTIEGTGIVEAGSRFEETRENPLPLTRDQFEEYKDYSERIEGLAPQRKPIIMPNFGGK